MYKETDEIFVRIVKGGFIPYINMCGPIPNPIKISTAICLKLVNAGIEIHQYDPATKTAIRLTRENVFDDCKFNKKKAAPTQTANKPVEKSATTTPIKFSGVEKKVEEPKVKPVAEQKAAVEKKPADVKKETD